MIHWNSKHLYLLIILLSTLLAGCAGNTRYPVPPAAGNTDYIIGPGDNLEIFVWQNSEVSSKIPVRPDGRISTPLVEDMAAAGKTPSQLARDMEKALSKYIKSPLVTVIVHGFVGPYDRQIRVVGAADTPQVLAYRANMTLLDVMIEVGGLSDIAAGNSASIVRRVNGKLQQYPVYLDDLIRGGDIRANIRVFPGDILIIPETWF